jgi:hypothetical protein
MNTSASLALVWTRVEQSKSQDAYGRPVLPLIHKATALVYSRNPCDFGAGMERAKAEGWETMVVPDTNAILYVAKERAIRIATGLPLDPVV